MKTIKKYNRRVIALVSLNAFIFFAKIGGSCAEDIQDLKSAYYATLR